MSADARLPEYLALASAAAAAAGTYPPWVVPAPGVEMVPAIYLQGMGWRVAGADLLVLALLAVGLATAARHRHRSLGGAIAAGTGIAVALACVTVTLLSLDGFLGTFVPGPGVAVTVLGGLGLVVAGWLHRPVAEEGAAAERSPTPDAGGR